MLQPHPVGVVLSITPTLPVATLQTGLAGVALSITPTQPVGSFTEEKQLTGVVLAITPTHPLGSARLHVTAYPSADISLGGWTDQAGGSTDIWQAIDEVTANDTDYIQSPHMRSEEHTSELQSR